MQSLKIKAILRYLMLIVIIVPIVIVGVVGFFSMSGFANSTVEQYARSIGAAQGSAIDQIIGQYERDIYTFSCDEQINSLAGSLTVSEENMTHIEKNFDNVIKRFENDVLNFVITDKSGAVVYDHEGKHSKDKGAFFGFGEIEALGTNQIYLSSIYQTGAEHEYETDIFYIARATQSDPTDTSTSKGYVIAVISTSRISELLQNTKFDNGNGYVAVSDGKGMVLGYNNSAIQKADATDLSGIFNSTEKNNENKPINFAQNGKIGCYGRFTGLTSSNWKWVAVYPAGIAFSQILLPILISIAVMLVLGVLCMLIGTKITNTIVAPMNVMIENMKEIKDGDRDKRFEINTRNELHEMAILFNGLLDEVCMSEELHKTISDISDNMLFEWDFAKEHMYVSDNFIERFDINPAESQLANGKFLDKVMTEEYAEQYKRDISTLLKNRTGHSGEYQMLTKAGTVVWFTVRAQCITDRLGEPLRVIGVVTDIDSEKKMELQLSERASYDFLSQLYNRSTFEKELQSEIERNAHSQVGVLFIDVDDFKFINDRFGHSVGDEVIKYVSGCIKQRVKGSGFAGRFGGDEFVLCITDPGQIQDIESLSLDLIDELYSGYHSELANVSINIKASIGIAFSPEHGENGKQVVAAADEAMYFVKKNGKANYHIYQPEDSQMEGLQHTL